jgi:transposase
MDLRMRVASALAEGETVRTVAKRFGVSVSAAVRIGQRHRAGRGQIPGKIGGHRRQALAGEVGEWLLARLVEKPDLTMRALTAELAAHGVQVAHDTVWRFVKRAGQTVKKDPDGGRAVSPEGGAVPGALEGASASARFQAPDLH